MFVYMCGGDVFVGGWYGGGVVWGDARQRAVQTTSAGIANQALGACVPAMPYRASCRSSSSRCRWQAPATRGPTKPRPALPLLYRPGEAARRRPPPRPCNTSAPLSPTTCQTGLVLLYGMAKAQKVGIAGLARVEYTVRLEW